MSDDEVMNQLRREIQAIENEPEMNPTPCGVCGSVVGKDLMILHMKWHREMNERADRYVDPPRYA